MPASPPAMRVRFVRTGTRGGGVRVQEWRSESTGRVYEVLEPNSYVATDDLVAGVGGHLRFERSIPVVTRNADDPVMIKAVPEVTAVHASGARGAHARPAGKARTSGTRRGILPKVSAPNLRGLDRRRGGRPGSRYGKWLAAINRNLRWILPGVLVLVVVIQLLRG